jgi:hypothetical protein
MIIPPVPPSENWVKPESGHIILSDPEKSNRKLMCLPWLETDRRSALFHLLGKGDYSQHHFATESTEFTEKFHIYRCLAFLGVLGDLCGTKIYILC